MSSERLHAIITPHGALRGVIHSGHADPELRHAVIIHGHFSSSKLGPSRLYVQIARMLAAAGITTWRFDCLGFGDSDGDFGDASYQSVLRDQECVMAEAMKMSNGQLSLVGHSMGTTVATRLAFRLSRQITDLVLIAPSFGHMNGSRSLLNDRQIEQLQRTGKTVRRSLTIDSKTVDMIQDEGIYAMCRGWTKRVDLIYGEQDEFYSSSSIDRVARAFPAATVHRVPTGDHNFLAEDSRAVMLRVLDGIVDEWVSANRTSKKTCL